MEGRHYLNYLNVNWEMRVAKESFLTMNRHLEESVRKSKEDKILK